MNDDPFGDLFGAAEPPSAAEQSTATAIAESTPVAAEAETPHAMQRGTACIFDIETGPLPEVELRAIYTEPSYEEFAAGCDRRWKPETVKAKYEEQKDYGWAEFVEKAALSPLTGSVLAIGYRQRDFCEVIGIGQKWSLDVVWDEKRILRNFWSRFEEAKAADTRIIGFNSAAFDLPFIVRRSWLQGVPVPGDVLRDGRCWHRLFVDLMLVWGCGNHGERCSLDRVSRYFGGAGKNGDGAGFSRLWNGTPKERAAAVAYLKNDLTITAEVAWKMGVI